MVSFFQVLLICLLTGTTSSSSANTEFSFRILFHLQNPMNTKGVTFNPQAWSALREAISTTLQIPVSQIGLGRVEEEDEMMERDVFVFIPVSLESKDYSWLEKDPMKIHSELYLQLDRSIRSKAFSETLGNAAIRYSTTEFANVHVRRASFEELVISKNSSTSEF
jgi:hypothetical protein